MIELNRGTIDMWSNCAGVSVCACMCVLWCWVCTMDCVGVSVCACVCVLYGVGWIVLV